LKIGGSGERTSFPFHYGSMRTRGSGPKKDEICGGAFKIRCYSLPLSKGLPPVGMKRAANQLSASKIRYYCD
jgi:hypothetical protein